MSIQNQTEEQVSTKEFLKSVFDFFINLGKNWQILLIALLIGTYYDVVTKSIFQKDKVYSGTITFHLELDKGGQQNQFMGLASSFGLGGGAQQTGADLLASANFEAIVLSTNNFQNAFLREIKVGNKKELFINYYIDSSDIKRKEWAGNLFKSPSPYINFRFTKKDPKDFTPYENTILSEIINKIGADTRVEPSENSSLIQIVSTSTNEKLTKVWIETLMEATEYFYKEMKTKKTKQLLVLQEKRLDSLSYVMKHNDSRLARLTFENPNVVDPAGPMRQQQLNRDNTYLSNQYYTQLANVENLNRLIFEQTPIFTILEPVRLPLEIVKKSGFSLRLSGLICFFITIFLISIRKTYLEIMSENNNN